jgi:Protein of unknown function (DUF1353)
MTSPNSVEPLTCQIHSLNPRIVVPKNFVTDFASVPRALWDFVTPAGDYKFAAASHDFLYWEQPCTKSQADRLFLQAMIDSDVEPWQRKLLYQAVRDAGHSAWADDSAQLVKGHLRFVPNGFRPLEKTLSFSTRYERRCRILKLPVPRFSALK